MPSHVVVDVVNQAFPWATVITGAVGGLGIAGGVVGSLHAVVLQARHARERDIAKRVADEKSLVHGERREAVKRFWTALQILGADCQFGAAAESTADAADFDARLRRLWDELDQVTREWALIGLYWDEVSEPNLVVTGQQAVKAAGRAAARAIGALNASRRALAQYRVEEDGITQWIKLTPPTEFAEVAARHAEGLDKRQRRVQQATEERVRVAQETAAGMGPLAEEFERATRPFRIAARGALGLNLVGRDDSATVTPDDRRPLGGDQRPCGAADSVSSRGPDGPS